MNGKQFIDKFNDLQGVTKNIRAKIYIPIDSIVLNKHELITNDHIKKSTLKRILINHIWKYLKSNDVSYNMKLNVNSIKVLDFELLIDSNEVLVEYLFDVKFSNLFNDLKLIEREKDLDQITNNFYVRNAIPTNLNVFFDLLSGLLRQTLFNWHQQQQFVYKQDINTIYNLIEYLSDIDNFDDLNDLENISPVSKTFKAFLQNYLAKNKFCDSVLFVGLNYLLQGIFKRTELIDGLQFVYKNYFLINPSDYIFEFNLDSILKTQLVIESNLDILDNLTEIPSKIKLDSNQVDFLNKNLF